MKQLKVFFKDKDVLSIVIREEEKRFTENVRFLEDGELLQVLAEDGSTVTIRMAEVKYTVIEEVK